MSKKDFLAKLKKGLSGLPQRDTEERLAFFSEMIDDLIEEGLTEENAVAEIGAVEDVVSQIMSEIPLKKLVKERVKPKRALRVWEIVLLVLGSPIWLSLLVAAFAVILSVYIVIWSVVISLWAVFGSLVGCTFGGIVAGIVFSYNGNVLVGIAITSAGVVCAGLSIFMFYGCKAVTKGILILTRKLVLWIKHCFIKKEEL